MALGANLHMDLGLGGTCHKGVAAVTCYRCLIILGMDSFSHRYIILLSQPAYLRPARKPAVESMFLSTLL